jgi:hypothetical protein
MRRGVVAVKFTCEVCHETFDRDPEFTEEMARAHYAPPDPCTYIVETWHLGEYQGIAGLTTTHQEAQQIIDTLLENDQDGALEWDITDD